MRRAFMTALYDRRRIVRLRREALPMPNIFEPDFDQRREHPGFRALRARLGWELATQRLGASVWEIEPGDVLSFARGAAGAHQVANWSDVTTRFLAVSTSDAPDLVVYPDSRKLGAFERLPDRAGLFEIFRLEDAVSYHEGERPPARPA
jgi:uncharacterized cupin superfamily protein